ncbi:uncharacterized protein TRIREDRAFT_56593 [Trichoderma reesei QM6a]|uniref:Predicted protein n=2 Tax=Hypocrea jecorina TaxID=51453 RepID=G0RBD7_HYPJQ|nr:uncharacterized protein TRIREDRAFT_56593 [Trichoderma reesei QM6a]EGR51295.1 predicted protein [Trichoderma reesei QM6a]
MRPLKYISKRKRKTKKKQETYNSRCSLVVTHPTTNLPVSGLSMGEQTGPRVFHYLWSYVIVIAPRCTYQTIYANPRCTYQTIYANE